MMKLYEIADQYQTALTYLIENEQLADNFDTLEAIEENLNDKLDNIGKLRQAKLAQVEAIKEEAKRLRDRATSVEKEVTKLENYIDYCLRKNDLKKVASTLFTFTYRSSTALVVTDSEQIPEHFLKPQPPKPDIAGMKKYIKEYFEEKGMPVPEDLTETLGVRFETKENLQIK